MNAASEPGAVIFDMDGVLITSEALKAEAHAATVRALGGEIDPGFYGRVMGQDHDTTRSAFMKAAGIAPPPAQYTALYRKNYEQLMAADLRVVLGVEPLLAALEQRRYRRGMVTSSLRWMVEQVFHQTGLGRHFDAVVTADDVERHKPAPDCYLLALERLAISAARAVVIEDSEPGVMAAAGAGIPVIALRHDFNRTHDFTRAAGAIDSLADTERVVGCIERIVLGD